MAHVLNLREQRHVNRMDIRVMKNLKEKSVVHDRFIMSDDQLWLLGSSLNEFGSRGTMMIRLSHAKPIADQLEDLFEDATPLADWHRGRVAQRES